MRTIARIDCDSYKLMIMCARQNCCGDMNQLIQGWVATIDPQYHDPDSEQLYSWICPDCIKDIRGH